MPVVVDELSLVNAASSVSEGSPAFFEARSCVGSSSALANAAPNKPTVTTDKARGLASERAETVDGAPLSPLLLALAMSTIPAQIFTTQTLSKLVSFHT